MIGHPKGDPRPIGVFDSGVGGISVLRALTKRLPRERFVYFGDSANAPYGVKSKEQILHLSREAVKRLCAFDVKAIVIACNTATAASAEELRLAHPHLPILGVEPAIRPAALSASHPKVLILATPMTLKMEKFQTLQRELAPLADFSALPCPGLVELIARGQQGQEELPAFLEALLARPCRSSRRGGAGLHPLSLHSSPFEELFSQNDPLFRRCRGYGKTA